MIKNKTPCVCLSVLFSVKILMRFKMFRPREDTVERSEMEECRWTDTQMHAILIIHLHVPKGDRYMSLTLFHTKTIQLRNLHLHIDWNHNLRPKLIACLLHTVGGLIWTSENFTSWELPSHLLVHFKRKRRGEKYENDKKIDIEKSEK